MVHKRKRKKKSKEVKKKIPKFTASSGFTHNGRASGLRGDRKIDGTRKHRD